MNKLILLIGLFAGTLHAAPVNILMITVDDMSADSIGGESAVVGTLTQLAYTSARDLAETWCRESAAIGVMRWKKWSSGRARMTCENRTPRRAPWCLALVQHASILANWST